jgi:hypothetical protein
MKKLLLLFTISLISFAGYTQCTPDLSNNHTGILPDSATNLPHAVVGTPYSTVLQVYVPVDTTSGSITCNYDYFKVLSVTGLPPGWSFACVPSNCIYPGNSHGCAVISGPAPLPGDAGNDYYLDIEVTYRLYFPGFPSLTCTQDTIHLTYYHIPVDPDPTGIGSNGSGSSFNMWQIKPNAFSNSTIIKFTTPKADTFTFKISNILGEALYTKSVNASSGLNEISLSEKDLAPLKGGVYLYSLGNNKNSITKRMLIQ